MENSMLLINLRRFDPQQDYPFFYRVYSDYTEQHNLFDLVNLNSPERFPQTFEKALSHNYRDTFIATEASTQRNIGFVISYGYSPNDGHIKVMEYMEPEFRSTGLGGIAILRFLQMLFENYSLRKVYTEVYAFNDESIKAHIGAGFEEEARLKEYRYYKGKYWDFITYSITRETFYHKFGRLLTKYMELAGGSWNED